MLSILVWSAGLSVIYICFWYTLYVFQEKSEVINRAWYISFPFLALISLILGVPASLRSVTVTALAFIWAVYRLTRQNSDTAIKIKPGSDWVQKSFARIFIIRALFIWLISFPLVITNSRLGYPVSLLDLFGLLVFALGIFPHASTNLQTKLLKRTVFTGDTIISFSFFIFALGVSGGWVGIIGPVASHYLAIHPDLLKYN